MWILIALISAAFNGAMIVYDKHLLNDHALSPLALGAFRAMVTAVLTLPFVFIFQETGALANPVFWLAAVANTAFVTALTMIMFRVLSKHDASLVASMFAAEPLFVIITAYFLLGETVSLYGFLGILVIIAGSVLLQKSRVKGEWETKFYHSPWTAIIMAMVFAACATAFSKMALLNGGVFIYLSLRYGMQSVVYLALLTLMKSGKPFDGYIFNIRHLGSGALLAGCVILEMHAVKSANVAYVQTVLGTCMFFTFIIEGIISKRAWNKTRLAACAVIFAGTAWLALYS